MSVRLGVAKPYRFPMASFVRSFERRSNIERLQEVPIDLALVM
jgi:hypothetical protein